MKLFAELDSTRISDIDIHFDNSKYQNEIFIRKEMFHGYYILLEKIDNFLEVTPSYGNP